MFIIEDKDHNQIGKPLHNLKSVKRPDGGLSSNCKVDQQLHDENGDVFFIREVANVTSGDGPRTISNGSTVFQNDRWEKVKTVGPALPPVPDPVPGDEGYDHISLRKPHMPDLGDEADAILKYLTSIRMQQSKITDAVMGLNVGTVEARQALIDALSPLTDLPQDLDDVIGQWVAVKKRFPKS